MINSFKKQFARRQQKKVEVHCSLLGSRNRVRDHCLSRRSAPWIYLVLALFVGAPAQAQTVLVTTAYDEVDISQNATIADLPGPDGVVSLREALRATDNTPGHQTVGFQIPPERFWLPEIFPDFVLIQGSFGFSANDEVTLDGTTQTAYTGDMNPDGWEVVFELGVSLNADNSEAFGFHGCDIGLGGNNSVIHDNTGKMDISVAFGTENVIRDNEADTIELAYASLNTVIRNTTERVRIWGSSSLRPTGNVIGGPDPADRNYITGWGNVGEHGSVAGTTVELYNTDQTLIENNWIGTTPDGMSISNTASTVGIGVYNNNHNLIIRNNLIAIGSHWGGGTSGPAGGAPIQLQLYLGGSNIEIYGNTLGLNALGEPVLGGGNGIIVNKYAFLDPTINVRIGGPNPGEGNIIAGHVNAGVVMNFSQGWPSLGNIRVSGNSIYGNGDIGIDLMPNTWTTGVTPNDPMDTDNGANGLQNYPEILAATSSGQAINVSGQLNSEPLKDYTLEFFASPDCDPTGFGEGELFLGSTSASTDAAGDAVFDVTLPVAVPAGWLITSTATLEPVGATSEFSACIPIQSEFLTPDSYTLVMGNHVSGTVADLAESDDQYLVLDPQFLSRRYQLAITIDATSPEQTPSGLRFSLESRVQNILGTVEQKIELFNFGSGQFESVDSRLTSATDTLIEVTPGGDPTRFVQAATNAIRARVSYQNSLPFWVFSMQNLYLPYRTKIDHIYWTITP